MIVTLKRILAALLLALLVVAPMLNAVARADDLDDAEADAEADEEPSGMDDGYGGGGYDDGYGGGEDDYGGGGGGGEGGAGDLSGEIKGFVDLDEFTFDKIVDGTKAAIGVFYEPYAHDMEDVSTELEAVAEEFGEHGSLHLVKVNVENNPTFVERYGITQEEMPKKKDDAEDDAEKSEDDEESEEEDAQTPTKKAFLYFAKGADASKPEKITVDKTKDAFVEFLTGKVGAPGTVEALVGVFREYSAKFSNAGAAKSLVAKAEGILKTLKGSEKSSGEYYLKVMGNLQKKGADHVQKEYGRLGRMVDGGGLKQEKMDEFTRRRRILKALSLIQGKKVEKDEL